MWTFWHPTALIFVSRLSLISVEEWKRLFSESGFTCVTEGVVNGGHYFLLEKPA